VNRIGVGEGGWVRSQQERKAPLHAIVVKNTGACKLVDGARYPRAREWNGIVRAKNESIEGREEGRERKRERERDEVRTGLIELPESWQAGSESAV